MSTPNGFDWNGNGKRDAFDSYMDMKVSSDNDSSSANEDSDSDSFTYYGKTSAPTGNKAQKPNDQKPNDPKPMYDSTKDSDALVTFKCFLTVVLCLGGIILPALADMGLIATLLCLFGGVGLSILILMYL